MLALLGILCCVVTCIEIEDEVASSRIKKYVTSYLPCEIYEIQKKEKRYRRIDVDGCWS